MSKEVENCKISIPFLRGDDVTFFGPSGDEVKGKVVRSFTNQFGDPSSYYVQCRDGTLFDVDAIKDRMRLDW